MIGVLLIVALLFYAVMYSGIARFRGEQVGVFASLVGAATPTIGPAAGPITSTGQTVAGTTRAKLTTGSILDPNPAGPTIIADGRRWIGTPYVFGGAGPSGMDCSGFVMVAYQEATGYTLPHQSAQQFAVCAKVSNPSEGDLCFYSIFGSLDHVGLVVAASGGQATRVLDCVGSHGGVSEHGLGPNEAHIVAYGRPRFMVGAAHRPAKGPHPKGGGGGG